MNEEGCSTLGLRFVFNAKTHAANLAYARKCGVNVARVEVRGETCVRLVTPSSLRWTRNDKITAGLPVEQQSHRGLRWETSTLYNGVQFTPQMRA